MLLGLCLLTVSSAVATQKLTRVVALRGREAGMPIATCGGTQDIGSKEQIQMEKEHGKPCKFPFYYKGDKYDECTEVDSDGVGAWCRTEFPDDCKQFPKEDCPEGDIRWGICNPKGDHCQSNPVDEGRSAATKAAVARVEEQLLLLKKFFSLHYWSAIGACSFVLLFFSEIVGPLVDAFVGHGFLGNGLLFVVQMGSFFATAAITNEPDVAASAHILALSTIMLVIAFLVALLMVIMAVRGKGGKGGWGASMIDDLSEVLRPASRCVVVFLLVYGSLDGIDTQWAGVAAFAGLFVFGIAMATTSIISDFLAYLFIRMNGWFTEGDLIYYGGNLLTVKDIHWRYTQAYNFSHRCDMYIPNGKLGNGDLVNQSQDGGRMVAKNIPLPPDVPSAKLEAIVKEIWTLLRGQDKAFTGLNGETYDNQINVKGSSVLISDAGAAGSAKELSQVVLTVKLKALYSYSTPPPFKGDGAEPDWRDRQWDWLAGWNAQQERVLLDVQKVLDKHLVRK
jgi:small-conductance mechanosensitive channel